MVLGCLATFNIADIGGNVNIEDKKKNIGIKKNKCYVKWNGGKC